MKTLKFIVTIAVLLSASSCKYFKGKKVPINSIETTTTVEEVEETPIDTMELEQVVEEIEPVEEPTPTGPEYGYNSDKYYMIVGSFFSEKLAHKYATKMFDMGYTPVIIQSSNQFYRVSARSYNDYNTAINDISNFRNNVSPRSWVHVKRN